MRALQTFTRLEGRVRRGQLFETNEEHAAYLAANRIAERMGGPSETPMVAPPSRNLPEPSEVNDEIKPVGGGWYEWRGKRYRGKSAAETAREQEG